MKKYLTLFLIFSFLLITPVIAQVVIVNPASPLFEISKKDLKNIYKMKKLNIEGGIAIHPVNLTVENEVRREFSEKYIGKDAKKMESYYLKRALSGKGQPPKVFDTEEEIIKYVTSTIDAIGYVSSADSSVKTISVK